MKESWVHRETGRHVFSMEEDAPSKSGSKVSKLPALSSSSRHASHSITSPVYGSMRTSKSLDVLYVIHQPFFVPCGHKTIWTLH